VVSPIPETTASTASQLAVAFARLLRGAGVNVPIANVISFAEALELTGLDVRNDVYWAGRATLIHHPEDQTMFDRAFAVFWERRTATGEASPHDEIHLTLTVDTGEEDDDNSESATPPSNEETIDLRFSAAEILRDKDFGAYTADELELSHQLMSRLKLVGTPRASRRMVRSKGANGALDLRRTVQGALRTDGEALHRHNRTHGERLRRLVLLLDVSGSMEPYARALVRFVHAAVAGRQKVEAFAIGTRLTRVTRELSSRDPDRALTETAARVPDWSGGTRLGEGLRQFNDEWGIRGMARGAIVVIMSDGWDRGDPKLLGDEMARLHRVAFSTVWVNPLKVTPNYAPLARGMAAALPYVDFFVEGHSVGAMERLANVISGRIGTSV
jgi:uncharacterized protein